MRATVLVRAVVALAFIMPTHVALAQSKWISRRTQRYSETLRNRCCWNPLLGRGP